MFVKFCLAVLNGIIVYIVLWIVIVILEMVGVGQIAGVISPFILPVAIIIALLTLFGKIPNYWEKLA